MGCGYSTRAGWVTPACKLSSILAIAPTALIALACAEALPDDIANYRDDPNCHQMNVAPLPKRGDDPHEGVKDVFACNVPLEALESNARPFPAGAVIIKESTRSDSDYAWLVATARKSESGWTWNEYSRNFEDEEFVHIAASEQVCIDCHQKVEALDWIYTPYVPRPAADDIE